jgi:hypothetical protein
VRSSVLCLALLGALPLPAARGANLPWLLPLMNGTLSGVFHPDASSPALTWRAAVRTADAGALALEISVDGKGVGLHGRACVDPVTGDGTWQVTECHFDLATWSATLTGDVRLLAGASMTGTLTAEGHGTIVHNVVDGTATLALTGGGMNDEPKKVSCSGIATRIVLTGFHPFRTKPGQAITVQSISASGAELKNVTIPFALAPGEVQMGAVRGAGFGGQFSTEPFVFAFAQPEIKFVVHAKSFELGQIRTVVDPKQQRVQEAEGKLNGKFTAYYNRDGFRLGPGALVMSKGDSAQILFQPTPGLFSSYIPQFVLVHTGLPNIEAGQVALVIKTLRIKFYPDGEQSNRSALIQIEAESADPKRPTAISFDININGSIQALIQSGADLSRSLRG